MAEKENDEIQSLKNEKEKDRLSQRKKEIQGKISKKRSISTNPDGQPNKYKESKEAEIAPKMSDIKLGEILNPQKYTGIIERDFHLYDIKKENTPNYVHIEPDAKPKCTCIMYENKYENKDLTTCEHIYFVLNNVLKLKENEDLTFTEEELKKAFENAEQKNKKIIRETYGIAKRKNFNFPNPKVYKYDFEDTGDDDGYECHEWRIKERLYSRGIVAEEFHASDNDYSETENTFDEYFTSNKEAKPNANNFKDPEFKGRQLELHKMFIEEE